jgi:hypothetical protein
MSAKMDGEINSKNMGAGIVKKRVLDRKIWAFQALGVKWSL